MNLLESKKIIDENLCTHSNIPSLIKEELSLVTLAIDLSYGKLVHEKIQSFFQELNIFYGKEDIPSLMIQNGLEYEFQDLYELSEKSSFFYNLYDFNEDELLEQRTLFISTQEKNTSLAITTLLHEVLAAIRIQSSEVFDQSVLFKSGIARYNWDLPTDTISYVHTSLENGILSHCTEKAANFLRIYGKNHPGENYLLDSFVQNEPNKSIVFHLKENQFLQKLYQDPQFKQFAEDTFIQETEVPDLVVYYNQVMDNNPFAFARMTKLLDIVCYDEDEPSNEYQKILQKEINTFFQNKK